MARILVFGDSIAYGADDATGGGWVQYLRKFLDEARNNDSSLDYSVYNQAISGDTTNELLKRFDCEAKYRMAEPDGIILFAIGINDATYWDSLGGKPLMSTTKFKSNLIALVKNAKIYTNQIILIGITPVVESKTNPVSWNIDVTYTNERIEKFEKAISEVAQENSLPFIPLFETYSKNNVENLLPDGVHPNTEGHKVLFEIIKKPLTEYILNS